MATSSLPVSYGSNGRPSQDLACMVCSKCWEDCFSTEKYRELCRAESGGASAVVYWTDESYVNEHASKDCEWCSLIQQLNLGSRYIIPSEYQGDTSRIEVELGPGLPYENYTPKGNNRLSVCVNGAPCYFTVMATENNIVSDIVTARPVYTDTKSDLTFKAINGWLAKYGTHPECGHISDSPLPTRLIDVASGDQEVRLVSTNNAEGRYAALSYCWGGTQSGKTLRASFAVRQQHINIDELSETVRQAIQTTRRMGLRYIWIDAICIIQDDETDRTKEISQMCDIYRQAYVTIVAASAASSSEGFLQIRRTPSSTTNVPFWAANGKLGSVSLVPEGHYDDSSESVNARCWTLQERLLSRRLVIFASHTIQLQCQREIVNSGDSMNLSAGVSSQRLPSSLLQPITKIDASDLGPNAMIEFWKRVITMYSERQIQRTEERLVALSGLAHAFCQALNLNYLAGLWSGATLPFMLLWEADYESKQPAYEAYIAPTWSWASHPGRISYPNSHTLSKMKTFDVEILSAITVPLDFASPLGKVTTGKIVLKARIQQVRFISSGDLVFEEYADSPPPRPPTPSHGLYPPDYVLPDTRTDARLNRESSSSGIGLMAIALASRTYRVDGVEYVAVDGLLVRQADKLQSPTDYQRVGNFKGAMQKEFGTCRRREITLV